MNKSANVIGSVLTSKSVWLPIVLGCGTMALTSGVPFFLGVAATAIGIGSAIWRLTAGKSAIVEQANSELQSQRRREHGRYLRGLQRKLRRDEDSRTGKMLDDVRNLFKRIHDMGLQNAVSEKRWTQPISEQVDQLYQSCVDGLEKSYDLWQDAQRVATPDLKSQLLDQRTELLSEVGNSIQHLGKSLDQIQVSLSTIELPDNDLRRLRDELDQGLEVARNVEQRISELDREIRKATRE